MPRRLQQKKWAGNKPAIIDLFSGVGGLSLGASRAGFELVAAVDTDSIALETHSINFANSIHIPLTVRTLSGRELLLYAGLKPGQLDGLVGGPPCQGFSVIGHRNSNDRRNDLFVHFFRIVRETQPRFFVAENVPGILSASYARIRKRALNLVKRNYDVLEPITVTATDYGVPTKRTRVFFVGFRKASLDGLDSQTFENIQRKQVCVRDALRGLPIKIDEDWQAGDGWRSIGELKQTSYLRKASGQVPDGIGNPEALERYFGKNEVSGCLGTVHEAEVIARFRDLEPGEKDPVSKAVRLNPAGFCPTLRAGTGSDRGSYQAVRPIHHREARVITAREAARLQGFPDWFVFHPTKWHSFRQIGNSVSPIVAELLLSKIYSAVA